MNEHAAPDTDPWPERRPDRVRRFFASTRVRLAATIVAVMLIASALVVVGVRTLLLAQLDDRIAAELQQERDEFDRFLSGATDPVTGGPVRTGGVRQVAEVFVQRNVFTDGEVIVLAPATGPPVASASPVAGYDLATDGALLERLRTSDTRTVQTLQTPGGVTKVLAVPIVDGGATAATLIIANFVGAERAEVDDAVTAVAQVTGLAVLLVAIFAWALAGRVLRPLTELTTTARRITQEDLSQRLDDPGGHDEVAVLVRTFNSMLARLEAATEAQRRFMADAGHDLRTPLTIVRGHLEQLQAGMVPDDEVDEILDLVSDETARMSRLVEDLVMLARAQQPNFLQIGPVDLGDLARSILRKAEAFPGPAWRAEPGVGVIEADAERLTQAALNLVSNAARYSPAGAPITIGTALDADAAVLWVADSGPGIPPADRARILERFARGPERRRSGSGLGLSIVTAIAEAHGGTLAVGDAGEGGARFEIRLPRNGGIPETEEDG